MEIQSLIAEQTSVNSTVSGASSSGSGSGTQTATETVVQASQTGAAGRIGGEASERVSVVFGVGVVVCVGIGGLAALL